MIKKRMIMFAILMLSLLTYCTVGFSQVMVTQGQTFKIKELDFRVYIHEKLTALQQSGQLKAYEEDAKKRVTHEILYPKNIGLTTQADSQTYFVDPSIRINQTVTDTQGHVLYKKGDVFNPFSRIHLKEVLIFFDGSDKQQVKWVKAHYQQYNWVKFILTGGELKKAAHLFGRIYYDQYGHISQKLDIHHVPAIAEQDGLKWKITVIGSKEF